ncbi:Na+/H+ antiporter subunit E [Maledivibacter halophilus]|uniref:Multicomponent Na+:H+ antiporter subunit E n=1 Tax=Maledivibacter halophilus TaxID=36842 RepID=A0A1T5KMV8_9FIRM|nr:Na+/H+ antiporter subunit E [Maledivibacter halophilus]SKC65003.1 multicomponent Na+:H+ antiporter subunit E [Maledivibacter halophilus]
MVNIMTNYKLFITLFIFWILLTFDFSYLNIVAGIIACFVVTKLSYKILYTDKGFVFKTIKISILIKYFFKLIFEIYKSSFSYIMRIIKKDCEPRIVEIQLDITDPLAITIISNSITLTPGTLTMDVNDNRLTVLSLQPCNIDDKAIEAEIKNKFEKFFIDD